MVRRLTEEQFKESVEFLSEMYRKTAFDYRELLKKYMKNVGDCEGVFFHDGEWDEGGMYSEEEHFEISKLIEEVNKEYVEECSREKPT